MNPFLPKYARPSSLPGALLGARFPSPALLFLPGYGASPVPAHGALLPGDSEQNLPENGWQRDAKFIGKTALGC